MGQAMVKQDLKEAFRRDTFEPEMCFAIEEANGDVDGKNVLARVKGTFFVPDGVSRNNRFYPKSLWEKVISNPEVQKRLVERRMFGTIGHEQKINDDALREGKISHIVVGLSLDGSRGVGEALIMDTPTGRILDTFLRAGSKLFVSSRADGSYKGEQDGVPVVDPDTYQFGTFDFVIDPGFIQANPKLVESLEKLVSDMDNKAKSNKGEKEMSTEALLEKMATENGSLKSDLSKAVKEVEAIKGDLTVLESEKRLFQEKADKLGSALRLVEKYKRSGTAEEFAQLLAIGEKHAKFFETYGSPEDISKALTAAKKSLLETKKFHEVNGSKSEITKAFDGLSKVLTEYKAIGTIKDIKELLETSEKMFTASKSAKDSRKVADLSKEIGVSEDKVRKLYGKMPEAEIREFFKDIKESSKVSSVYRKSAPITESKKTEAKKDNTMDKTRGRRLMESLSR